MNDSILDLIRAHGGSEEMIEKRIRLFVCVLELDPAIHGLNSLNRSAETLDDSLQTEANRETSDALDKQGSENLQAMKSLVDDHQDEFVRKRKNLSQAIEDLALEVSVGAPPLSILIEMFNVEMSDYGYRVREHPKGNFHVEKI